MGKRQHLVVWALIIFLMSGPGLAQSSKTVVINEFMASNGHTLTDAGQYEDWIELYNTSSQPMDMGGMYLTDDLTDLTKWQIPQGTTLGANDFLLVWADGDTQTQGLHAGFNLASEGEELGLSDPNGTLIDSIVFEGQLADVSYGRWPDGNDLWQYMATPTPGKANVQGSLGVVADVELSPVRGFYDAPIDVTLSTTTEGAEIWYTLDANVPHTSYIDGRGRSNWIGQPYTGPIRVDHTTCIRAVSFKAGWRDSTITSHTYLFLDDVIRQPTNPKGFPTSWGGRTADYAMDQRVVNNTAYSGEIKEDLKSIPLVCIVIPNADFFGPSGIYSNPSGYGEAWERAACMEWIDPCTGDQFGVNAGLRIHGGQYSRSSNIKKPLRFLFKGKYGPSKLTYPLFPDTQVQTFNTIVLRSIWNFSWTGDTRVYGADYLRDVFARDTIRDMGCLTPYGRPVHVYINGLYWGMYIMTERPDDSFAAAHLGGSEEDYDVLKASNTSAMIETVSGDQEAWKTLFAMADAGVSSPAAYQAIQKYVDLPALIDYMLMVYYTGSRDAPILLGSTTQPRNFYAIRSRNPAGPFVFLPWDVEWVLEDPGINRVTMVGVLNPHYLMSKLVANSDFKTLLADRIHVRLHNDGALTRDSATDRYTARADEIYGAIVGESARWGDVLRSQPYTRSDWQAEVNRLVNQYFSGRTETVLGQLRERGWYPQTEAPAYQIDGQAQHGGAAQGGAVLTMVNPNATGTVYYTLDGSDPRLSQSSQGPVYSVMLLTEDAPKKVWVPTMDIGEIWRGGNEPFDDSTWTQGTPISQGRTGAVGYEAQSGYEAFITYDVRSVMYGKNASCYIRIPFTVESQDQAIFRSMTLRVRCDDGFVAFLNGVEVAAVNRPATLTWNSRCATRPESSDFMDMDISSFVSALRSGNNVLAVHGLNRGASDSDFLFSAELIASEAGSTDSRVSLSAIRYTEPLTLKASAQVKARVLTTEWSALNEAVYAVGPVMESLRISELMYHPLDPNAEFIELTNVGTETINLALVRFTQGIDFTFPAMDLAPGQYVLVVGDVAAFESVYGKGLSVAGPYSGSLSNGREQIQLCDALGRIIVDFTYEDNWYALTDGQGYSLTVVDVKADPSGLSSAGPWRPSARKGGSPGRAGF